MEKLEIQGVIDEELSKARPNKRVIQILYELKSLNKQAYLFMKGCGKTWKQKYHLLWREPCWKEAKLLLREYFYLKSKGDLRCSACGERIKTSFILHHADFYNAFNLFTPLYVSVLCSNRCHSKLH